MQVTITEMQLKIAKIVAIIVLLAGIFFLGAWVAQPKQVLENTTPKPQVIQSDGSVVAERSNTLPKPNPPHQLPKGSKEERRGSVLVKPKPNKDTVKIDYSLTKDSDGGKSMVFSSEDGKVITAVDIPIEKVVNEKKYNWSAQIMISPDKKIGVAVTRDIGRIQLGAAIVDKKPYVSLGWKF